MGLFGSKHKEFTSLAVIQMIDNHSGGKSRAVSKNDREGLRMVLNYTGGSQRGYIDQYMVGFRRQYRRRFQEHYLRSNGFMPTSAQVKTLDVDALAKAMGFDKIISFERVATTAMGGLKQGIGGKPGSGFGMKVDTTAPMDCEARSELRKKYNTNWDNDKSQLTKNGKVWTISQIRKATALDKACNSSVGGGGIGSAITGCHIIEMVSGTDKMQEIFIQKNTLGTFNGPGKDIAVIKYMKNKKSNCYVEYYDQLPPASFKGSTMYFTPIVMLKENDRMVNMEKWELSRLLKRFGVEGDDLIDSLAYKCDNEKWEGPSTAAQDKDWDRFDTWVDGDKRRKHPGYQGGGNMGLSTTAYIRPPNDSCPKDQKKPSDIDNAYLFVGIYPDSKEQGNLYALYEFFDRSASNSETNMKIGLGNFSVEYNFTVEKVTHSGRYNKLLYGQYASGAMSDSTTSSGGGMGFSNFGASAKSYYKQISDTQYIELKVKGFQQRTVVYHQGKARTFRGSLGTMAPEKNSGDTMEEAGRKRSFIICPLDIYNHAKYRDWLNIYENGLSLAAYAHKKVKLKWYQRGIFKILIMVVVAIVTVWMGPGGLAAINLMNVMMQMAINFAISIAVQMLGKLIGSDALAMVIALVVMAVTGMINIDLNMLTSFDGFLSMATKLLDITNAFLAEQRIAGMDNKKAEIAKLKEENETMAEMLEDSSGPQLTQYIGDYDMTIASNTPNGLEDPDQFFYKSTGDGQYDFDFLWDVDAQYKKRKNVKTD